MAFNRPGSSVYPQVYETFKAKASKTDKEEEFVIRGLTENFFDDAVDVVVDLHLYGESAVFYHAARTLNDEKGVERVRAMYRSIFEQKVSLICLKVDTQEIAGLNCLGVAERDFIKEDVSRTGNISQNTRDMKTISLKLSTTFASKTEQKL